MDIKYNLLFASTVLLFLTSVVFGFKFVRKGNYLLGWEWWVISLSTACVTVYLLTEWQTAYNISVFCDRFTRGVGAPIIAICGLMAVTHGFKPPMRADILLFVTGIVGTVALISIHFLVVIQPYYLLIAWTVFSIFLAYFSYRLMRVGAYGQAIGLIGALLVNQIMATIYDFYPIPGDDQKMIFFTLALTAWSYLMVQVYYAYCALERAQSSKADTAGRMVSGLARR